MHQIADLIQAQSGVVARRQVLEKDFRLAPHDIRRWVRNHDLVQVHPGVYVNHTGELSWLQRAWAAVLAVAPAALAGESAMRGG